jgi:hypothetical protein
VGSAGNLFPYKGLRSQFTKVVELSFKFLIVTDISRRITPPKYFLRSGSGGGPQAGIY